MSAVGKPGAEAGKPGVQPGAGGWLGAGAWASPVAVELQGIWAQSPSR